MDSYVKRIELRQKKDGVFEDKISNLPDVILTYILSFLPTKKAVSTSILSTRWKSLWAFVPNLSVFIEDDGLDKRKEDNLLDFVDRALIGHKMPFLEEIDISCSPANNSRVISWISAAAEQDVRTLKLNSCHYNNPVCDLPSIFFTMNKIVTLHLIFPVVLCFPVASVCLPNLKELVMCLVVYENAESLQNLISSCPVLEELFINRDELDDLETLNVSSRSVKRLSLLHTVSIHEEVDHVRKIIIDCPAVEYIHLDDNVTEEYVVRDLSSIVNAKLDLSNVRYPFHQLGPFALHVFELLTTISNVKVLSISDSTMSTLSAAYGEILPTFHNLTCLEFCAFEDADWNMKAIIEFLKSTPKLEVLVFEGFSFSGEEFSTSQVDVPNCLISHLKTIKVNGYLGKYDLEKYSYFLKNSKVLEDVNVNLKGAEELENLRRSSRACRVSVSLNN